MIQVDAGYNGQDLLALSEGELLQHLLCLSWQHSDDHTTCLVYDLNPTPNQRSEQQSQKEQWSKEPVVYRSAQTEMRPPGCSRPR